MCAKFYIIIYHPLYYFFYPLLCGEIVHMLKRCMGHLYEHLQKGKECAKGTIIDFEKTVQASSNGENRKSLQLLFVDIGSYQSDDI